MSSRRDLILVLGLLCFATLCWTLAWGPCAAPWNIACFTNGDWGDYKHHYQGWIAYLRGEYWFPPYQKSFTWPYLGSALTTDSIPLVALLAKPLTHLFGLGNWQYFSLASLLNCFLVVYCTLLIAFKRRLSSFSALCLGFILISSSISWTRLRFGHESLQLHGLILLAIAWIITRQSSLYRWTLLVIISVGVHAYYAPMILAAFLALRLSSPSYTLAKTLQEFSLVCLGVVLGALAFGYLPGYETASNSLPWSANLLSLIDPQEYSSMFTQLPVNRPFQMEGYSYLGIGILIAVLITLAGMSFLGAFPNDSLAGDAIFPRSWWVISLILLTLSLGPNWWLGDLELFQNGSLCTLPGYCLFFDVFRSMGRFTWPFFYTLTIFSVDFLSRLKKPGVLLAVVLILQLIDSNLRTIVKQGIQYADRFKSSANPSYEWAKVNPSLATKLHDVDLVLVSSNPSLKKVLPPPYTFQYLKNQVHSNWGGEGMTRWPKSEFTADLIPIVLDRFAVRSPSILSIPSSSSVLIIDDSPHSLAMIELLERRNFIKYVKLAPAWHLINVL